MACGTEKLERKFYERSTLIVAKDLLGKYLFHISREGETVGKVVETEAYLGIDDPASHTYRGRLTERTRLLFGPPGHVYVYLIYGMYLCFNLTVERKGRPGAVFIRAIEPVNGLEIMCRRRGFKELNSKNLVNLTNGPGKLCQAMGITKDLYGEDLCGDKIFLTQGEKISPEKIDRTPRINIEYAKESKEYPWRFIVKGSKFLSIV